MREALLVAAHGPARLFGLRLCDGRLRYAYDQSPEQAQHQGRVGLAHTAAVLVQGNVQRMVQPAFDDPTAALEFEQPRASNCSSVKLPNQIDGLGAFLAVAPDPPSEPRNEPCAGEAHLLGGDFAAFQEPNLTPATVVFPVSARVWDVSRGGNSPASTGW